MPVKIPLIDQLADFQLLLKCWKNVYQGKSDSARANSKGIDNISIDDFDSSDDKYLNKILILLQKRKYKFSNLRGYPEPKKENGKFRLVTVATVPDRIVHKAILSLIVLPVFPYINTGVSYCGVKDKIWKRKADRNSLNTKHAIEKLAFHIKNKKYCIFKSDIKAFYDEIPKRKLFNKVIKVAKIYFPDTSLLPMIKEIIFFHLGNPDRFIKDNLEYLLPHKYKGISQGSPLSQIFSNIYLVDFDQKMKKVYGDSFIRYIDDFIIVCNTKKEAYLAGKYAERILKKLKLKLSPDPKKTLCVDLRERPIKFLGLNISKEKISSKYNNEEVGIWADNLLNENNIKLYRKKSGWLTMKRRIEIMNNKIIGQESYLIPYHPEDFFTIVNKHINHKKTIKKSLYKNLVNMRISKINSFCDIKEWQSYFK